jgi:hypothetical protein
MWSRGELEARQVGLRHREVIVKSIRLPAEGTLVLISDWWRCDTLQETPALEIAAATREGGPDDRLSDDKSLGGRQSLPHCGADANPDANSVRYRD